MRLLLVEDDHLLGAGLSAALGSAGFKVSWARDGCAALECLERQSFAAMVLDIGLPGASGLDVLRQIRRDRRTLPVLMLTARDTTRDKVVCLDAGADDYLLKTAEVEELVARLRALLRRQGRDGSTLVVGELALDLNSRTVVCRGETVSLSRREFDVLRALMESAGRVLTRGQLEQSLYGWNGGVESNAIEVYIHNLRHKLAPCTLLKTVRGVGYILDRPVP